MTISKYSRGRVGAVLFAATLGSAALSSSALAAPGVPSNGKISFAAFYGQTNGNSQADAISDDGRFVLYFSTATNIDGADTNTGYDGYHYDRLWGITTLVTASANGTVGNGSSTPAGSWGKKMSANGRYVLFMSWASNLVSGDTNGHADVFVRDTGLYGGIERVSVGPGRTQINAFSFAVGISADGRKCLFNTDAGLVPGDTNGINDLYVYDRTTQTTSLVSKRANGTAFGAAYGGFTANGAHVVLSTRAALVPSDTNGTGDNYRLTLSNSQAVLISANSAGVPGNNLQTSWSPISGDGSRAVVDYNGSDFDPSDTNGKADVYVKYLATGQIVRVSVSSTGAQSAGACLSADISNDGRYVSFTCDADDLVPGDTNGKSDVFVKDLQTGALTRVSRVQNGAQGNDFSAGARISGDGSQVAFGSWATNLATPDTNGASDVFVGTRQ
jgi:hypothetical protein